MSFEWVDSESALDDVVTSVLSGSRYAIDTEFHREKLTIRNLRLYKFVGEIKQRLLIRLQ